MCAVSYKFVSICSDKSRNLCRKLSANPGTTHNIPGFFSVWFSPDKNSYNSFWVGLETSLSLTFIFFFLLTFIRMLILLNTMENFAFFCFFVVVVVVVFFFLRLEIAWIWWCNPISSSVCYSRRFTDFYWNFSPKKRACNMSTELCQASHAIAMCWENSPRTSSCNPWL